MTLPPAVFHGLLSPAQHARLNALVTSDIESYAREAATLSFGSPVLFGHLFMGQAVAPHMVEIERVTRDKQFVCCVLPRDSSKTTFSIIQRNAHNIAYRAVGAMPRNTTLLIKESSTEAQDKIRTIMGIFETNELIKLAFGDVQSQARIWNTEQIVLNVDAAADHPTLMGVGMGQALTGKHPDELQCDDMVSVKNSKTAYLRNDSRVWWSQGVNGIIGPTTRVWNNFTRYYIDDLNAYLLKTGKYYTVEHPALMYADGKPAMPTDKDVEAVIDDEGRTIGVLVQREYAERVHSLWPCPLGDDVCPIGDPKATPDDIKRHFAEVGLHRPMKFLLLKFLEDPHGFRRQYMNFLMSGEELLFKPWMVNLWTNEPELVGTSVRDYMAQFVSTMPDKLPGWFESATIQPLLSASECVTSVHAWDHAISKKKGSRRTAVCMAYRSTNNRVFLRMEAFQVAFVEATKRMISFAKTDPVRRPNDILTEGINFQAGYSEVADLLSNEIFNYIDIGVQGNKATAAVESGIVGAMETGRVYFQAEDIESIQEFLDFTGDDKSYSDRVDAARMAYGRIKSAITKKPQYTPPPQRSRSGLPGRRF